MERILITLLVKGMGGAVSAEGEGSWVETMYCSFRISWVRGLARFSGSWELKVSTKTLITG